MTGERLSPREGETPAEALDRGFRAGWHERGLVAQHEIGAGYTDGYLDGWSDLARQIRLVDEPPAEKSMAVRHG